MRLSAKDGHLGIEDTNVTKRIGLILFISLSAYVAVNSCRRTMIMCRYIVRTLDVIETT